MTHIPSFLNEYYLALLSNKLTLLHIAFFKKSREFRHLSCALYAQKNPVTILHHVYIPI